MTCPTPCDLDCIADCHEWHEVVQKRSHNVYECPSVNKVFEEFVENVQARRRNNPDEREGQAAYTVLHSLRQDLAERVDGSRLDPFYSDDRLPAFLGWLRRWLEIDAIIAQINSDPRFDLPEDDEPAFKANLPSAQQWEKWREAGIV